MVEADRWAYVDSANNLVDLMRSPTPLSLSVPQSLAKLFDPLIGMIARPYQAAVGKELKKYGLRYEDLYDPQMDLVSGVWLSCIAGLAAANRALSHPDRHGVQTWPSASLPRACLDSPTC